MYFLSSCKCSSIAWIEKDVKVSILTRNLHRLFLYTVASFLWFDVHAFVYVTLLMHV